MDEQVNLRGMTVAKLSKRLLDSPAINAEQVLTVSTCVRVVRWSEWGRGFRVMIGWARP